MSDTALGTILEIDKTTIDSINDVSTAINAIADAAEKTATRFNEAFGSMLTPVDKLNTALQKASDAVSGMETIKVEVDTSKVEQSTESVTEMSNSITEAAVAIAEFKQDASDIHIDRSDLSAFDEQIDKLKANLAELERQERDYQNAQTSAPKGTQRYEEFQQRIDSTAESITKLSERIATLQSMKLEATPEIERLNAWLATREKDEKLRESTIKRESKQLELQLKQIQERAKAESVADSKKEQSLKKRIALEEERARLERAGSDPKWAIENAAVSKSYSDRAKAIKYLEEAIKNLDSTDENYKNNLDELTSVHKGLVKEQKEVEKAMGKTRGAMGSLALIANQLKGVLASVFSIRALVGFSKKLIEVRGEFELQNTALAAILNNKEKADQLFNQITELAVKSPFTIRQLTTYTKELAAYQVEYKNLFNVTKQLADVSAGLGVDMQRLILAYGQVKAANYLRATEVRQFTEAGINILGELAKYYTELEGTMVSVADVQERVTKRMVEFGDVEEIFNRITRAGGLFYDMQAKQAETLRGMWMNLQDRIDLMMNEIGKSTDGVLKAAIKTITSLMDNYDKIANVIKKVITAFILYKTNLLAVNREQMIAATRVNLLLRQWQNMVKGIKSFPALMSKATASMRAFLTLNAPLLTIALAWQTVALFIRRAKERNEEYNRIATKNNAVLASLYSIRDAYETINKTIGVTTNKLEDYNKKFAELAKLNELLQNEGFKSLFKKEEGVVIPVTLEDVKQEDIDNIFQTSAEALERAREYGVSLGRAMAGSYVTEIGQLVPKSLDDYADAFNDAFSELSTAGIGTQLENIKNALVVGAKDASAEYKKYLGLIQEGRKETDTEVEWRKRELSYLERMTKLEEVSNSTRKQIRSLLRDVWKDANVAEVQLYRQAELTVQRLAEQAGGMQQLLEDVAKDPIPVKTAIDRELADKEWSELAKNYYSRTLETFLKINLVETNDAEIEQGLKGYAKVISDIQDKAGLEIPIFRESELKKVKTLVDASELLNKALSEERKALEAIGNSTVEVAGADQTAAEEKQKHADAIDALITMLNALQLKEANTKSAKTAEDIAKERIDLLKKVRSEYEENLKVMDKVQASEFTKKQFADSEIFKDLTRTGVITADLDLDASGLIESLDRLAAQSTAKAKKLIQSVIAELNNEEVKLNIKTNLEDIKPQVQALFDRLDLTKEIEKLGLGKEVAEELFGFESIDLDGLEKQLAIIKQKYAENNHGIGEEQQKYFTEIEKKIADQRKKALQERLKTYSKYLQMEYSAAVKAKLEEAKKLAEIAAMEASGQIGEEQAVVIRQSVRKESSKAIDKAMWEQFKDTDMYIQMFEDLEFVSTSALDAMEQRLVSLRGSLKDLDPQSLKEIQRQLQKIREVRMERTPIKSLIASLKKVQELNEKGLTADVLQQQIESANERADAAQREADIISQMIGLRQQGQPVEAFELAVAEDKLEYIGMTTEELQEQLGIQQQITEEAKEQSSEANNSFNAYENAKKAITSFGNAMSKFGGEVSAILSDVNGLIEDITGESSGIVELFGDLTGIIGETAGSVVMLVALFGSMGEVLNSAFGVVGLIVASLQAVVGIVQSIVNLGEKNFQKNIEAHQERVDALQKSYEKLSDAIDSAYSADQLKKFNKEAENTLKATIAEEKAMVNMYKAKKNGESKYKEEIQDLTDAIESQEQELIDLVERSAEKWGAITTDNILSTAEEFVSAWRDAFRETGNGIDALGDKFDELIDQLILRQAALRIGDLLSEKFVNKIQEYVDKTSELGEEISKTELAMLDNAASSLKEELNNYLKALYTGLGFKPKVEGGELGGLSEAIGSMTEDTANVLAAITESIRFFSADSNLVLHTILTNLTVPEENPFYVLMQQQAQYTLEIRTILENVSTMVGLNRALRVQIV